MTANELLNFILKAMIIVTVSVAILDPEAVGYWQAQKDVAYDSIWTEWISDCDCTD